MSRTIRGKRMKTLSTGTIRTCITICWSDCATRERSFTALCRSAWSAPFAIDSSRVRCTTISPIMCISRSSRSASTRTVCALCFGAAAGASAGAAVGSTAAGAVAAAGAAVATPPASYRAASQRPMPSWPRRSPAIASVSADVASHSRISADSISPASITAGSGSHCSSSPCSSALRTARKPRTPGMSTSSASVSVTAATYRPARSTAATISAGGPATVAAANSSPGAAAPPASRRCSCATTSPGSDTSAPVSSISSTRLESVSRQPKSVSRASRPSPSERLFMPSITFSISCVSDAIREKPIVALIPFRVCATRKMSLIVSTSRGSCSIRTSERLSVCRCSRPSARNIGR